MSNHLPRPSANNFQPTYPVRRHFLQAASSTLGSVALASLLDSTCAVPATAAGVATKRRAKRIIYLFQSGGPPQQDLF
ncbi:MAG: sulfatase, partial [Pirellulaceae bacterium]